jgi:hypothetical protein
LYAEYFGRCIKVIRIGFSNSVLVSHDIYSTHCSHMLFKFLKFAFPLFQIHIPTVIARLAICCMEIEQGIIKTSKKGNKPVGCGN